MKKDSDSRSSGGSCFPATKQNKTTHYAAYFTTVTCTLTETEGKASGPIHVSNILKRTLEYLVIHNEMKLAQLGMLVHFGQQNGDTDRLLICLVSI